MIKTDVLIIGASVAGLACAACLQQQNIPYVIIEKEGNIAKPWHNHYERLHLHTPKSLSNLPYKKFDKHIPTYPSRIDVINYLEDYRSTFNINPVFNTEALSISKENDHWITTTNNEVYQSKFLIMATGAFEKPKAVALKGMQSFTGKILHSYQYKTGKDFTSQKVLVIGFGNSACEIAIDLFEQGAKPSMSVRSAVNVIPRDLFGIPILKISLLLMSKLPVKLADAIANTLMHLKFGDLTRLGLKKKLYGVFEQIKKEQTVPLLDIGTIQHIRSGHIKIYEDIDYIENDTVHFIDGSNESFDVIIAAIGYYRNYASFLHVDASRFDDLKNNINQQKYFGKDGLYFCGYWIAPTGQIREIGLDAMKIAGDIKNKIKK